MNEETAENQLKEKFVRTHFDGNQEKWYFSVVDVIGSLSGSVDPQSFWRKIKQRLIKDGKEDLTKCQNMKILREDGKMRYAEVVDSEQLVKILKNIPSTRKIPTETVLEFLSEVTASAMKKS